jgi:hypothetical protein
MKSNGKKYILSTRLPHKVYVTENYDNYTRPISDKIRNFILFKLLLELTVFDIAIKIYKQKYGVTSSVAMATGIGINIIVVYLMENIKQSGCKCCPIYISFYK